MYSTHVFSEKNSKNYIGIGDPYGKKEVISTRFKGKAMSTNPGKLGQNCGTFDKFPETKPETYVDKYKVPPRKFTKMGFGSNDPEKRSEFSLNISYKQYQEKIKGELKNTAKVANDFEMTNPELEKAEFQKTFPQKQWFQTQVPFHSYDVGREKEERALCNKCTKETFYCKHRIREDVPNDIKELRRSEHGNVSPTSYNTYGSWSGIPDGPKHTLSKPKAGRISTTKQFFDNSHLLPGKA